MPEDLRALPRLRDSIPYLYLERGRLTQTKNGVVYENKLGRYAVPVAQLCAVLAGPGLSVTHRAVVTTTRAGCSLLWVGEEGVRFYAGGHGETRKAYALQKQAEAVADPEKRLRVVERMYRLRFDEPLPDGLSIEQVRGHEGARVRKTYAEYARRYGVTWTGRRYDRFDWANADPVNRALSTANACLNGVCHAAIVSAGYSPGLGFIHQGKQLAFVYDIADLYKAALTIPVAFATASDAEYAADAGEHFNLERETRYRCRQAFRNLKVLHRIVPDIQALLNLDADAPLPERIDPDDDFAHPTAWWEPPPETTLSLGDGAYGERPSFQDNEDGDPLADWTPDGPSN
ncbi:MAG: type I-E CRISPR-associated endonuclease Cas1e [Bacteroidota bacterium]